MRRSILLFLLFATGFFISPVYAAGFPNPQLVEQLKVDFGQYGTVRISQGDVSYIELNVSTFQNTDNQKAIFPQNQDFAEDEFKNEKLRLIQRAGGKEFDYSVKGSAEIFAKHTIDLPSAYSVSESEKIFLMPTKGIQSDNPEISELARNITRKAANDFEKAALLAIWVHSNVNYTLALGDEAMDAVWVLNNRMGTCDEFSSLFIAMVRSIGIPAKYISGWVYGSDGWQKHAWAEVYLGKWVPIDPTWLEAGNLDATHIKFMETADNYIANQAKAAGTGIGNIEWVLDNTTLSAAGFREIVPSTYELFSSAKALGLGKTAIVGLKITPEEYSVDEFDLEPCKGMDIVRVENQKQSAILEAGKRTVIFWKISSNHGLDPASVYTCPLTVNSRFFAKKTVNLTVDPRIKDSMDFSLKLDKDSAEANEMLSVSPVIKNPSRAGIINVGIVSGNTAKEREINLDNSSEPAADFTFPAGSAGSHTVYLYTDRGDTAFGEYTVYETGNVFIDKIIAPDFLRLNETGFVLIYVRNNKHAAENAKIAVKLNDALVLDQTFSVPQQSFRLLNLTIPHGTVGTKTFSVRLAADSVEEKIKEIRVYDAPRLRLSGSYDSGAKKAVLNITPRNDDAKNIEVTVGGEKNSISGIKLNESASMSFGLAEGAYDARIGYSDVAGNRYEISQNIGFRKKGILDFVNGIYLWLAGLLGR